MIYVYAALGLLATLAFVWGFIALVNKLAGEVFSDPMDHHEDQRSKRGRF
ncbi:hypothetical protein [Ralstonia pickettii]|nr:hypothetical protein [Ralstonia pickettii]MBX4004308.1 hypothetical protein [Ralstonia pickettii]MBX4028163.1 hypothetical protein [Ralstonia pickettii]MBX4072744.1 hypothetical protein [Ralstonia pickettii]MBX4077701.1 hypothetical protein [Ralstonia pickettii]MBX4090706.1 hypothetical protein [Ralstonia pickettii]